MRWYRPISSWPRPRRRRSAARSPAVAAYVGVAIAVVIFAVSSLIIGVAVPRRVAVRVDGLGVLHGVLLFVAVAVAFSLSSRPSPSGRTLGIVACLWRRADAHRPEGCPTSYTRSSVTRPARRRAGVGRLSSAWSSGRDRLLVGIVAAPTAATPARGLTGAVALALAGAVFGAFTAITFSPGRHRPRYRRRLLAWIALMVVDVVAHRRCRALRPLHPDPDHRDQQGDTRVAADTTAARTGS